MGSRLAGLLTEALSTGPDWVGAGGEAITGAEVLRRVEAGDPWAVEAARELVSGAVGALLAAHKVERKAWRSLRSSPGDPWKAARRCGGFGLWCEYKEGLYRAEIHRLDQTGNSLDMRLIGLYPSAVAAMNAADGATWGDTPRI